MLGVYVHIPFCERKCNYCAFSSFVEKTEKIDEYIGFLSKEIENFAKNNKKSVDTIYIGGGTPSLLSESQIEKIVGLLKENFALTENCEITVECNPNSLTKEKLLKYKSLGINRLSIGVQSLDDDQLSFIGRLHSSKEAIEKIKLSKEIGFENISVDLLIGLNGATAERFLVQLQMLIYLDIKHISTYMLQIEDNTPLKKMVESETVILPTDEESVEIYEKTAEFLNKNGFYRYEVSNFAKKGYESKHNFKYWTGEDYIGFGLSAHSYMDGRRWSNANNFKGYYQGEKPLDEVLSNGQKIEEHIMLGLRCKNGIDISFLRSLGYDIEKNEYLNDFIAKDILIKEGNKIYINEKYYGVNNFIIVHLLPF